MFDALEVILDQCNEWAPSIDSGMEQIVTEKLLSDILTAIIVWIDKAPDCVVHLFSKLLQFADEAKLEYSPLEFVLCAIVCSFVIPVFSDPDRFGLSSRASLRSFKLALLLRDIVTPSSPETRRYHDLFAEKISDALVNSIKSHSARKSRNKE
jgi:hypothetical protein